MSGDALQSFRLDGRTALVTGAAGHLGWAIAAALGEAGAHVLLNGRRPEPLEALAAALRDRGIAATPTPFDVTEGESVRTRIAALDRLDVLVNNAYAGAPGKFGTHRPKDYARAFDIAVTAAAHLVDCATPQLRAAVRDHGDAAVVNVASMYGMVSPDPRIYGDSGADNPAYYGAAKAALIQYTRYAAVNLAADGIRVNALSPGAFPPDGVGQSDPGFYARLCDRVPLGRAGRPEELKGAVLFLAAPAARYVTGANLPVDGGWTAW
jgi:NAD(P)-dependent dehydrogenase (short-subunit alcohol dehydrogenase family)